MAFTAVAAAVTVAKGAYDARQAKKAGQQAAAGYRTAADAANARYLEAQNALLPYQTAATTAQGQLDAVNRGDYSGFESSPDYLYARSQAQQGIERGAAARGSLYSGGTNVDLARALSGLASQNLGNYRSSLTDVINRGFNASTNLGSLGQGNAASVGQSAVGAANAQANATQQAGQAWSDAIGGLGQVATGYLGSSGVSPYTGASTGAGSTGGFGSESDAWYTGIPGAGGYGSRGGYF